MHMESHWITAARRGCLTLIMTMAATHAWAEQVALYTFRTIIAKDKAAIDEIQSKLKAGADFGKLAMESSTDRNSAKDGGLMRETKANSLHGAFAAELESLKPGERSAKPRNSSFGWFVMKLESVTMVEDDTDQLMQAHKDRDEKMRLELERRDKAKAEYEEAKAKYDDAKAKFESCARRASDLEGENKELNRRINMFNLGSQYPESELRSDQARFKRKVASFDSDCSRVTYYEGFNKVCSHPAFQSRWCDSAQ